MEALETLLGHRFADSRLLEQALSHPSWIHESKSGLPSNQRLEFLGDAVLQLLCSAWAMELHPKSDEGSLTQWRARYVSASFLASMAQDMGLDRWLRLGKGERSKDLASQKNLLADAFEALVGALFLDAGYVHTEKCLRPLLLQRIHQAPVDPASCNPKGILQEHLQRNGQPAPNYHCKEMPALKGGGFITSVVWQGEILGQGQGTSKKQAEVNAARDAIHRLKISVNELEVSVNKSA